MMRKKTVKTRVQQRVREIRLRLSVIIGRARRKIKHHLYRHLKKQQQQQQNIKNVQGIWFV
jgi:hypothetical protein